MKIMGSSINADGVQWQTFSAHSGRPPIPHVMEPVNRPGDVLVLMHDGRPCHDVIPSPTRVPVIPRYQRRNLGSLSKPPEANKF